MKMIAKQLLGVIAILGIVACGAKKTEETDRGGQVLTAPEKLTLYSWSEYFDPEVLDAFTKQTGIAVDYVSYEDADELEARLQSEPGRYDVVVTDDLGVDRLKELRLLADLDHSLLSGLGNVDSRYRGEKFDPDNKLSVPYLWGTTLLAYRNDKIAELANDWSAMSDPAVKGKLMVLGDRTEALGVALMAKGLSPNSDDPEKIDQAADHLIELIETKNVRFGSDTEVREGLKSGDVWLAVCYSGDAAMIAMDREDISFFIPSSGAPLWMDSLTIAKSSKHSRAAHQFIDFMLDAENAAANANFTWYGSTNRAAEKFISEDLLADDSVNPSAEVRELCKFFAKPGAVREQLLNAAWTKVQKVVRNSEVVTTSDGEPSE